MKIGSISMVFCGLILGITGCGFSGAEPGVRLNIVNGQIVFADKRVNIDSANHSLIQFHPQSGESGGQKIYGNLIEGSYSILTEEDGEKIPGAPEGDYLVTVTAPTSNPAVIPRKYKDPKTTDLLVHVEEGDNEIVLELTP